MKAAAAAKTLRIGSMAAMTGWYAFESTDNMDVKNMAQIINDKGGITITADSVERPLLQIQAVS